MSSERWRRANDLFEQALALPAEARAAFVETASDGDATLHAAVVRWLDADDQAAGFLDEPLVPSPATPPQPTGLELPRRLGPYRVLEEIGRGGMGVVYRGLRDDEAFRREVAIKVLSHGGMSPEARQRLDAERRILATLDHPGIARVYDGGTAPSGLPFLVMEYVEGETIDQYCDQHELSVRQRVLLFRHVCEAVQASHQKLVVHCDLKPSNILVTEDGRPKLLDFGIAKLLREEGLGAASDPITHGSRPLTPQYASPEQRRGEPISTASDVYALGVLLFKLLTGQRPDILQSQAAAETERRLESVPERPSTVAATVGAADRARHIRGDLDAIVLKAMRSEAAQRYRSVEQLSTDLWRHLEGFSVDARQGNTRYRLGKFIRRHRVAVATAVLFVSVLGAYAFSMASMAGRLAKERDRLKGMSDFTLGILDVGIPDEESQLPTLVDAVEQNVDLNKQRLHDQPAVLAAVLGTAADVYLRLDQPERARAHAEDALAIHATLDGEDSLPYANARVRLGSTLTELDEHDAARTAIQESLDWLRRHPEIEPTFLVRALNALVADYCYREDHASADALSAEAWRVAKTRLDPQSVNSAAAAVQRGAVLSNIDQLGQAQALYRQGIERYEHHLRRNHPFHATLLNNLAKIYANQGDHALAWETYRRADDQYVKAFGETASARLRPLVGIAEASAKQGNHDDALGEYRKAVEVSLASARPQQSARVATYLAGYLLERGDCSADEVILRRSLEVSRAHLQRSLEVSQVHANGSSGLEKLEGQWVACGFSSGRRIPTSTALAREPTRQDAGQYDHE